MQDWIAQARAAGDSVGGIIECAITGLPAGIGEPMFGGVESKIAQIVYGIPAVKGVEFGIGFDCACVPGSSSNDDFTIVDGKIVTTTNNAGGILGGITNGMPVIFTTAIKATSSIGCTQKSISLRRMEESELNIKGRHDPCIVPRAVPVVEAAAAIAIYDLILGNTQTNRRK
jgi:chorismate synthase